MRALITVLVLCAIGGGALGQFPGTIGDLIVGFVIGVAYVAGRAEGRSLSPSGLIEHYGLWVGLILLVFWGVVTTRKQYDLYLQYRVILTPDEALRLARRERR